MSVNKVILLGNVGQPPKLKEFDNGDCVANMSLATTKKGYTTKDGKTVEDRTEWHNIVLRNNLAKVAVQYVKKGHRLYLEGELRTRKYTDDNKVDRFVTEVICHTMEMLTPKQETAQQTETQEPQSTAQATVQPAPSDDLPF